MDQIYYAGIGSRETPQEVLEEMRQTAILLAETGVILRSGGAAGADSAFEEGCLSVGGQAEIYLPWRGFNGNSSKLFGVTEAALAMAAKFHPAFQRLSAGAKALQARNSYQCLGRDLATPSAFVLCYTSCGCESAEQRIRTTGGTGQAISIASSNGIPVINMANQDWKNRLEDLIDQLKPSKPRKPGM